MGGRGSMMNPARDRVPEYKTVKMIDGVKVLERLDRKLMPNLPIMSNTPNTGYMLTDKDGNFEQFRTYNKNREPALDIDYDNIDGIKKLHAHDWVNGKRTGGHRDLTAQEIKKYGGLLRATNVNI